MKSISIHGVDEETTKLIRKRAAQQGRSVNKMMKDLIAGSLGLKGAPKDKREEFADLCGVWTEEEAKSFLESIGDMGLVDKADWT